MGNFIENEIFLWERVFEVDRIRYKFFVTQKYEVMFTLVYGILPDGRRVTTYDPLENWHNKSKGETWPVNEVKNPVKKGSQVRFKNTD